MQKLVKSVFYKMSLMFEFKILMGRAKQRQGTHTIMVNLIKVIFSAPSPLMRIILL